MFEERPQRATICEQSVSGKAVEKGRKKEKEKEKKKTRGKESKEKLGEKQK